MTVFGGFSEPQFKDKLSPNVVKIVNFSLMALVGFAMFFLSFNYVLPNDVFTSALFFDGMGLQPVFSESAGVFSEGGIWEELPDVTTEAFVFGMALLFMQLFAGYRASVAGRYTKQSGNIVILFWNVLSHKERVGINGLNWQKIGWISFYWFVAFFDTGTDAYYRSWYGNGNVEFLGLSLIVSFFFYSMFSEWAIVVGSKTTINYSLHVFGEIKNMITIRTKRIQGQRQKRKKQRESNRQQRNPQQRHTGNVRGNPLHQKETKMILPRTFPGDRN